MATCTECLHYEVCADFRRNICETDQKRFEEYKINPDGLCDNFTPKSDYVKRERGEWIERKSIHNEEYYVCSACVSASDDIWRFCPNCGADMRKEDNNA